MSKPTLMIKGKLKSPTGDETTQRELNEVTPIDYLLGWFKARQSRVGIENRVLVLKSETASGKSTMFPPELYKAFVMGKREGSIICTQPRVMTAIENVNEILKHYYKSMRLGESIGWSTKYNKMQPQSVGLLSATIGTLIQIMKISTDEEFMKKYRFVLIDETHERDVQTDTAIYMLKGLLTRNAANANCPFVVLMSATFEPSLFLNYFGLQARTNFIWCVGETAGFDEMWDWNDGRTISDYTRTISNVVEIILREGVNDDPLKGDILAFLPGKGEITESAKWLSALNEKVAAAGGKVFSLLQIDSIAVQTRNFDYIKTMYLPVADHVVEIKDKKYKPSRRMILTTNVAETGLTLENLKYVIDCGYNREIEYNPVYGVRGLITKPAPKSRIRQRRGRAGRKFRGVFYPLYPKYIYDKLPDFQLPQILLEDLSPFILSMLNAHLASGAQTIDLPSIDFLEQPATDALTALTEKLHALGYIGEPSLPWDAELVQCMRNEQQQRVGLTALGHIASRIANVSLESIRMILSSYFWEASALDTISIAAYLAMDAGDFAARSEKSKMPVKWDVVWRAGLRGNALTQKHSMADMRLLVADDFINGAMLANALKTAMMGGEITSAYSRLESWCKTANLSVKTCLEFVRVRDELIDQFINAGVDLFMWESESLRETTENTFANTITKLKLCIYDGFRMNILVKSGDRYATASGLAVKRPSLIGELNIAMIENMPRYVLFASLELKQEFNANSFVVATGRVSIMDGYVSPDLDFSV